MRVVIIEDELPAANRLERLLKAELPDMEIIRRLDSIDDSIEFFQSGVVPDLVFMDIQLADGLSFEIFEKVKVSAPVIFTTAYDHYAIKAFKVNSIDYLLKPIDEEDLKRALAKFKEVTKSFEGTIDIKSILQSAQTEYRRRFLVKSAGRLLFIGSSDVSYFFSEEGMTFIVNQQNERYILEQTLEELEGQVDPREFFRINRKMIIASKSIERIEPYANNRLQLTLKPHFTEEVVVSRHRTSEFKHWLDS